MQRSGLPTVYKPYLKLEPSSGAVLFSVIVRRRDTRVQTNSYRRMLASQRNHAAV
jgi:hypothetical protein